MWKWGLDTGEAGLESAAKQGTAAEKQQSFAVLPPCCTSWTISSLLSNSTKQQYAVPLRVVCPVSMPDLLVLYMTSSRRNTLSAWQEPDEFGVDCNPVDPAGCYLHPAITATRLCTALQPMPMHNVPSARLTAGDRTSQQQAQHAATLPCTVAWPRFSCRARKQYLCPRPRPASGRASAWRRSMSRRSR